MRHAGFSLVELISVMVIIGILAVVALPRFAEQSTFDGRGFYDQTLSALRYAQKTAIASRRNVCIVFSTTSLTLKTANASGSAASCLAMDLAGPEGVAPYTITARSSAAYAALPTNFQFDALGRPFKTSDLTSLGQTITVSGLALNIVIEAETGYVHP